MQTLDLVEFLQRKFIGTDDLRRQLTKVLGTLSEEGGELVVTQHGKPQAILVDLETYFNLFETIQDLQTPGFIDSVYEGFKEIDEGKGIFHKELKKRLKI